MEYMAAQMDREIEGAEQRYNAALEEGENPAFPVSASEYGGHGTFFGLTLRDHFASKALQGICAHPDTWGRQTNEIAKAAYELADAMLATRVKP
ncbi:hypothetical protein SJI00_07255 [Pseudomonas sp. RP23018S]|uniref:hypothetical protein n=1 Tax=Pseudomonas sp. RP23018S TaxID=3096037 RepID=UPI002ACAB0F5|nr:hypothetical protein [Pseudomonas sp. RP23018S]MDZ5602567.1 hypothetical protein [Pseudomonas sp. RP23018S]